MIVAWADALIVAEGNSGVVKAQGRRPGISTLRPAGIREQGMHARVVQEPGRSRRQPVNGRGRAVEANEVVRDVEKSERRSRS